MYKRTLSVKLKKFLKKFPVILIVGARQVGKTTLVRRFKRNYVLLDDVTILNSALNDPHGFIENIPKPVTIDECQKAPQLLQSIKYYVDTQEKTKGDFLLTGSANLLNLKKSPETLAGRLIELTLYPFSSKEKNKKINENIVDLLFNKKLSSIKIENNIIDELYQHIIEGGYPLSFLSKNIEERALWFNSYISTYIERDIRTIGELRNLTNFIKFYNIIFPRSSSILNKSELSKLAGLNIETVENYLSLLEDVYQIYLLKPFFANVPKRFIKSPKIYVTDSGILCHILGIRTKKQLINSNYKGAIFETYVFSELLKHINYSDEITQIYYYRTHNKKEIDFILERYGKIILIEVKAGMVVSKKDFYSIIDFQKKIDNSAIGIIFYSGNKVVSFGENLFAIPISIFL